MKPTKVKEPKLWAVGALSFTGFLDVIAIALSCFGVIFLALGVLFAVKNDSFVVIFVGVGLITIGSLLGTLVQISRNIHYIASKLKDT